MDKERLKRLIEVETSARQDIVDTLKAGKVLGYDGLTVMFRHNIEIYRYDREGFFDRIATYEWNTMSSDNLLRMITLSQDQTGVNYGWSKVKP